MDVSSCLTQGGPRECLITPGALDQTTHYQEVRPVENVPTPTVMGEQVATHRVVVTATHSGGWMFDVDTCARHVAQVVKHQAESGRHTAVTLVPTSSRSCEVCTVLTPSPEPVVPTRDPLDVRLVDLGNQAVGALVDAIGLLADGDAPSVAHRERWQHIVSEFIDVSSGCTWPTPTLFPERDERLSSVSAGDYHRRQSEMWWAEVCRLNRLLGGIQAEVGMGLGTNAHGLRKTPTAALEGIAELLAEHADGDA